MKPAQSSSQPAKPKRLKHFRRRQQFEADATSLLKHLGAVEFPRDLPWPQFTLETSAGLLRISIHTGLGLFSDSSWPWIATRFDDVARAREILGADDKLNPWSGKWNRHYWRGWTDDFAPGLEWLERDLKRIGNGKTNL
jgi:hypothetical protein